MSPIQQMLLGVGAVATKTYVDDIFSTFVYAGNSTARSINNGLDLAGEGGMLWVKRRNQSEEHIITDTARGAANYIASSNSDGSNSSSGITSFNSTGFSLGTVNHVNGNNYTYVSWAFRKAPGFFDIVEWSGTGSTKHVSHNLGVVPGAIWIKRTNANEKWVCWHKDGVGSNGGDYMVLNSQDGPASGPAYFGTDPVITSTTFEVNSDNAINNGDMIAYVFAGGGVSRPNNTNVRCVEFNGTSNSLFVEGSADFDFGTGDFTVEFWATVSDSYSNSPYFLDFREDGSNTGTTNRIVLYIPSGTGKPTFWLNGSARIEAKVPINLGKSNKPNWQHFALVRSSGTTTFYIDGIAQGTYSDSTDYDTSGTFGSLTIGNREGASQYFKGGICDLRITKGQALYTENFNVPATALTTTSQGATASNVKLLCCQNTTATGSTVTPDSSYPTGSGTDSTQGPKRWAGNQIEDFVFGESGNQNLIKCGKYIGNGSESDGTEVHIGWEPQWLLVKQLGSEHWGIIDVMRGWTADGQGDVLFPNRSNSEDNGANSALPTSTGFKLHTTNSEWNGNNEEYIYIAIRRSDGYVGKPPELGTDVFAMDTGNASSTIPTFDSGFAVDWAFVRQFANTDNWGQYTRLTGDKFMRLNTDDAQGTYSGGKWDSNVGWAAASFWDSNRQSWMWKRHAGFDCICFDGDGVNGRSIAHSMNDVPEMMIVKRRSSTEDWTVYHTGLTSVNYHLTLNSNGAEVDMSSTPEKVWKSVPTATHFEIGSHARVNTDGEDYLALLFSSIEGISKVGSYSGSNSTLQVTTGFQPRLVIIKRYTTAQGWVLVDSLNGDGKFLSLHGTDAVQTEDLLDFNSTGFELTAGSAGGSVAKVNGSGESFIYYAHA